MTDTRGYLLYAGLVLLIAGAVLLIGWRVPSPLLGHAAYFWSGVTALALGIVSILVGEFGLKERVEEEKEIAEPKAASA